MRSNAFLTIRFREVKTLNALGENIAALKNNYIVCKSEKLTEYRMPEACSIIRLEEKTMYSKKLNLLTVGANPAQNFAPNSPAIPLGQILT